MHLEMVVDAKHEEVRRRGCAHSLLSARRKTTSTSRLP
jgi:hypothetical protein